MRGWVEQTGSGAWRIRVRIGQRAPTLDTLPTREEAERVLAAAIAQTATSASEERTFTVAAFVAKHVAQREAAKEIADGAGQRAWLRLGIEQDPVGRVVLRRLTRAHVIDWTRRLGARFSRASVMKCLVLLRGALKSARDRGLVRDVVAEGIRLPRERRTEEPWTFLNEAEQSALIGAVVGPERWLLAFAIGTGMRPGELAALRLADVHTGDASPRVIVRYGSPPMNPTKSGKPREVPLFGLALQAWREWSTALPTFCRRNPLGLAFPRARGAYRDPNHILRWSTWQAAVAAAGITRPLRWYDATRHTCASSLVSGFWGRAWRLEEIQAMLGHSSYGVTQRYAHLAGTALQAAAEATKPAPLVLQANRVSACAPERIRISDLCFRKKLEHARDGYEIRRVEQVLEQVETALRLLAKRDPFAVASATDALAATGAWLRELLSPQLAEESAS